MPASRLNRLTQSKPAWSAEPDGAKQPMPVPGKAKTELPGWAMLTANWERALFMHFELPAEVLRPHVPFELDLFEGRAWVSLVAFTMRGMRLARGGRMARWLARPFAEQRFLNVRTYVQHGGEGGIYFIAEWVSHGFCVPFGPITYGLPYRWGRLLYRHEHERGWLRGSVAARRGGGRLEYEARLKTAGSALADLPLAASEVGSWDEFLLERYVGLTQAGRRRRQFRIAHQPWPQLRVPVGVLRQDLLQVFDNWWASALLAGAHYSPGVMDVGMGRPCRI